MKRMSHFTYGVIMITTIFLVSACSKNDTSNISNAMEYENVAFLGSDDSKTGDKDKKVIVTMGHRADQCGGKCVRWNGELVHMPCWGAGVECKTYLFGTLDEDPENEAPGNDYESASLYQFVINDASNAPIAEMESFEMPARSMYVESSPYGNNIWLNCPEQEVTKSKETENRFVLQKLFFSKTPVYN